MSSAATRHHRARHRRGRPRRSAYELTYSGLCQARRPGPHSLRAAWRERQHRPVALRGERRLPPLGIDPPTCPQSGTVTGDADPEDGSARPAAMTSTRSKLSPANSLKPWRSSRRASATRTFTRPTAAAAKSAARSARAAVTSSRDARMRTGCRQAGRSPPTRSNRGRQTVRIWAPSLRHLHGRAEHRHAGYSRVQRPSSRSARSRSSGPTAITAAVFCARL